MGKLVNSFLQKEGSILFHSMLMVSNGLKVVEMFPGYFVFNVRPNILYRVHVWTLRLEPDGLGWVLKPRFGGLCSVGRSIVLLKNNI